MRAASSSAARRATSSSAASRARFRFGRKLASASRLVFRRHPHILEARFLA
jgi:hypothetical protein